MQLRGTDAYNDPEIAKSLGLSNEQKEKIRLLQEEARLTAWAEFASGDLRDADRRRIEETWRNSREQIQALLTDDQKEALEGPVGRAVQGPAFPPPRLRQSTAPAGRPQKISVNREMDSQITKRSTYSKEAPMRFGRWFAAGVAMVLVVPLLFAQGRARVGGGGGGSLFLLTQKSVQDELKLSEEQVKKVTALEEKQREGFKGFKDLSKEDRKTKMEERAKETKKSVDEILKPEQVKRLKQISLQQSGSRAFSEPEVAEALKLSDEQKEKIKTIQEDAAKEMRGLFTPDGDRAEARKKMEAARKATDEKVQGVLSAEQKSKFKDLAGEPFKGEIKRPEFGKKKKSEAQ